MDQTHFPFSKTRILALPSPSSGRKEYHDTLCPALTLVVSAIGTKTFNRYGRVNGKPQRARIGIFPEWTVERARERCVILNGEIAKGLDPAAEKRDRRSQKTVQFLWDWYLDHHAKRKKTTWPKDEKTYLRDIEPFVSKLPIAELTRAKVIELRDRAIDRDNRPSAGRRVVELISSMYGQAIDNDWVAFNPAYRVPKPPKAERDRYLQESEIPVFFSSLASLQPRPRDFLLLCIFTGQRRANVMSMRIDEIDWETLTWTIPKEKVKGRKSAIVVPLAAEAAQIIRARLKIIGDSPWIFPSPASKTGHYTCAKHSWKNLVKATGLNNIRIHDLRRTLGSWQANQGTNLEIIGQSLGHKHRDTTKIYARLHLDTVRKSVNKATKAIRKASQQPKKQADE